MYKLLLCWRYLRTRYLALACIVSVMLGVATLIVVNSIMSGFSTKLKERLHGLLSDIIVESAGLEGFPNSKEKMEQIKDSPAGQHIAGMTTTVETFAMLQFRYRGQKVTRAVKVVGIDPDTRGLVGGFTEHLARQKQTANPSFAIPPRAMQRYWDKHPPPPREAFHPVILPREPGAPPPPAPPPSQYKIPKGIIMGHALASYRDPGHVPGTPVKDIYVLKPGDDVTITTVSSQKMTPVFDRFIVCDYFQSGMSEYDSQYVFVPMDYLQHLRTMEGRVTSIQMKLKDYGKAEEVIARLEKIFPSPMFRVQTWEHKQGPLLAAIAVEKSILNILLFLIIAVAGFGILAIFSMIVVEKTRDIGILKSLGASNRGVMGIFLGYGLLLGIVGAGLGTALGLAITLNINDIEETLGKWTGQEIFDKSIYYFTEIPVNIEPMMLVLVNLGAIAIAVMFSVLPALRAAMLHPVRALRYE